MKDYRFYLWVAYLSTAAILFINLLPPLLRHQRLLRKQRTLLSLAPKK